MILVDPHEMSKPSVTVTLNLPEDSTPSEAVTRHLLHWVLEGMVKRGRVANPEPLTEEEVQAVETLWGAAMRNATLEVSAG